MFKKKAMLLLGSLCLAMTLFAGCGDKTETPEAKPGTEAASDQGKDTEEGDPAGADTDAADTDAADTDTTDTEEGQGEEPAEEPATEGDLVYMTNTSSVNMWASTNKTDGIIAVIPLGREMQVIQKVDNEWAKVSFNNKEGYVKLEFLTETRREEIEAPKKTFTVVTTAKIRLRSGPSTKDVELTKIPEGEELESTGEENGWYKVIYNRSEGYVSGDYIKVK